MVKENMPMMPNGPQEWNTYLLEKVGEVTDKQIEDFEKNLTPRNLETFRKLKDDSRIVIVAINNLDAEEISALENYIKKESGIKERSVHFAGLHNVAENIARLKTLTGRV